MLKRTRRGSVSRLMAAVAIVLACVQASAMALANVACCCQMAMSMPADCPMRHAAAMPAHHHHMDGMQMDEATPQAARASDDTTCRFACCPLLSSSMFVTPGVTPATPVAIAVSFVPAPTPPAPSLRPIDLAPVPHAPPPRA